MSDARRQELERLAASGDPEARRALFLEAARAGDPELLAALELRHRLRWTFHGVLDALPRAAFLPFPSLLALLAEGLASDASPDCGYAFRELGAGPWLAAGSRVRVGALVVRQGEAVVVGVGCAQLAGELRPSAIWAGLSPWHGGARPATHARRLAAWVEAGDWAEHLRCRGQEVLRASRSEARALCRWESYAGPRGYDLWARVDERPLRTPPRLQDHFPGATQKDRGRLEELQAERGAADLAAALRELVGHAELDGLTRDEARHAVTQLEAWAGSAEPLSPDDLLRVQGIARRIELAPAEQRALLVELASVETLEAYPRARLPALLQRLRALERAEPQVSQAPRPAPPALESDQPWIEEPLDDEAFAAALAQRSDAQARRRLGAQWSRRVLPRARYADLPALTRSPRERWRVKLTGQVELRALLAASPLGVAVSTSRCVHLLDADTGALRAELPAAKAAWQVAEVLVLALSKRELAGYDLWTGAELYRTKLKAPSVEQGHVVEDLFVSFRGRYGLLFEDPRQAPEPGWGVAEPRDAPLSAQPREVRFALERFQRCDPRGSIHVSERYREVGYFDEPGRHEGRWWLRRPNVAVALTPELVLQRHVAGHLSALDRLSGEERVTLLTDHHGVYGEGLWVSRDTVYVPSEQRERCLGIGLGEGAQRWLHAPEGAKGRARVAPGWGRVYLITRREALCLEPGEEA